MLFFASDDGIRDAESSVFCSTYQQTSRYGPVEVESERLSKRTAKLESPTCYRLTDSSEKSHGETSICETNALTSSLTTLRLVGVPFYPHKSQFT